MAGGLLGDNIGLREEVINKACGVALKAHKSPEKPYLVEKFRTFSEANVIISFPGSWGVSDWFVSKPFGETQINLTLFPSLRSVGNDEAALVNQAFLRKFESILSNSSLKSEVKKAMTEGKQIVFTGHSSGAAVAILATFWALEEYRKTQKFPFCVTFGSPLIGNHIFSHATRRENWSHHFIHFVMRYDIVPRILLAPYSSIDQILGSILQFFTPKSKHSSSHHSIRKTSNVTYEFYSNVMRNAATVTSHAACTLMGSTNLLLETVTNFVELSPYRPFGTYIFCTGNGHMVVMRNSDAVFQVMFHAAQVSDLSEASDVAYRSMVQNLNYETELQESLGKKSVKVVNLDQLELLPLSATDGSTSIIDIAATALGLNTRARLCLRAAGELEKQKHRNETKIEKEFQEKAQAGMKNIEIYKKTCEIHKGYYDSFKAQKTNEDFQANVNRLVLAGVWDEIIEMLKRYELPDEFEGNPKWVERGTQFRCLVEPLDIANYYRHSKNEDTGPYMIKARPKRYRYTQRWVEHFKRVPNAIITESSFWAEVEELQSWTNNKKPFEDVKQRVVQLEQEIKKWSDNREITNDVFLKESTFVKWWETLPVQHRATSCIASLTNH